MRKSQGSIVMAAFAVGIFITFSCTEQYLLKEPENGDAIRVIVVQNELETYATALSSNSPLEYDLRKAFQADLNTKAWLFHYEKEKLVANFPQLTRYNEEELAFLLRPIVSDTTGFLAPPAKGVWKTQPISSGSSVDALTYQESTWQTWSNEVAVLDSQALRFQLSTSIGCPLPETTMKLFALDDPKNACSVKRDSSCNWTFVDCVEAQLKGICENLSGRDSVSQSAAGNLNFNDLSCIAQKEVDGFSGTDARWSCSAGVCGESEKQIGAQYNTILTSENSDWAAKRTTGGTEFFTENMTFFSHENTLYEARIRNDDVIVNLYQWVLSLNGSQEFLNKEEIRLTAENGFDFARDGRLERFWGTQFQRNFILEFSDATYLMVNRADDPSILSEIDLEVTHRVAHGERVGSTSLLENPVITPSYWQQFEFFALTRNGIATISANGSVSGDTPESAGVIFDESKKKVFVSLIDNQEYIFVCRTIGVTSEICENQIFAFRPNGELTGVINLPHELLLVSNRGQAVLQMGNSILQIVQLLPSGYRTTRTEILIPGFDPPLWSNDSQIDFLINSDFGDLSVETGVASIGIGRAGSGGIVELSRGLSTGISVFPDGEAARLRGMLRNAVDSKHYLLFEAQSDPSKFQWIEIPIIN